MINTEKEERARRFKLALRAGIPILLLVFLLFYSILAKGALAHPDIENLVLMGAIVFASVYFIFFLLEVDAQETLLDPTSKAYNLKSFISKVKKRKPKSIAIIQINNLNAINENYGTTATNGLLQTIVFKLYSHMDSYGIRKNCIGRSFGAEFLVAADVEHKIFKDLIENFVRHNGTLEDIEVDYSFAVTDFDDKVTDKILTYLKDLLASQHMQEREGAVKLGRIDDLTHLEKSTVYAMERGSVELYFRPVLNVKSGRIDNYEISAKLKAEDKRELLPREYLPIVNRLGLGRMYDLMLFRRIAEVASMTDEDISFTFNLSPYSLRSSGFLEKLIAAAEEREISTSRFIIELYERKTYHKLGNYLKILKKFRAEGFQICIDNFGASNASMEYIKHFKFDRVQFDRDFVSNLDEAQSRSILKSLIEMCRELDIATVAKWVDNDGQKRKLIDLGIDYLQGFGIGKVLDEYMLLRKYNQ